MSRVKSFGFSGQNLLRFKIYLLTGEFKEKALPEKTKPVIRVVLQNSLEFWKSRDMESCYVIDHLNHRNQEMENG